LRVSLTRQYDTNTGLNGVKYRTGKIYPVISSEKWSEPLKYDHITDMGLNDFMKIGILKFEQ
jgi:hypothetical protein